MSLLRKLYDSEWDHRIIAAEGGVVATMSPVTSEMVSKLMPISPLVETLCIWRNQHRTRFFDTREITPQSTIDWLRNLTASEDRLFFIVHDLKMRPVAQYGLRCLDQDTVELDNGILGTRDVVPDLYYRLQMRMLELSHHSLGFKEARARVLADNVPALFLHKRCGLRKIDVLNNYSAGRDVWVMAVNLRDMSFH
jgi:hypothetical protein